MEKWHVFFILSNKVTILQKINQSLAVGAYTSSFCRWPWLPGDLS